MIPQITEAEARGILSLVKYLPDEDLIWSDSPEHSSFKVFSRPLVDETGATIAGLTLELTYRVPNYADDCRYSFSVFAFRPGGKKRVYGLDIVPNDVRSHTDEKVTLSGPHQHIGDKVDLIRIGQLDCRSHEQWFRHFLTTANIQFGGRYFGPFDGGLFQ